MFCCYGELVSGQAYEGISARHRCCLCLKGIDPREGDGEGFYSNLGNVVSKSEMNGPKIVNTNHNFPFFFFLTHATWFVQCKQALSFCLGYGQRRPGRAKPVPRVQWCVARTPTFQTQKAWPMARALPLKRKKEGMAREQWLIWKRATRRKGIFLLLPQFTCTKHPAGQNACCGPEQLHGRSCLKGYGYMF